MRRFVPAAIALVAFTACPLAAAPTVTETLADDASLNAVAAFNAARAWAVGDRGVVLRTIDGGETWTPGETPTDAQLFGVWFLDDRLGWAVGGSIRPHTHESRGVVLRTIDGGARWESIAATPVPRLQTIRMFDAERGVAAGDGGPLDPSGVFTTDNGGRNWRPVASPEAGRWTAGAFGRDPDGAVFGLLVGPRGVAALADRRVRRPIAPSRRGVHAVAVAAEGVAWLVGGRATVRVSRDRGATWASPPTPPPSELAEWFDWRAAAAVPGGVVAVGAPGAVALRSTDGGASWSTSPTGVATPLSAIAMTRDGHGWAVGDYGVIVATHDGGATWRPQRGAGRRAAALVGVATPEQTPCEWLAAAATAEGARTVVGCPFDQGAGANDRLAEAAGSLGAIAATADGSVALRPRERSLEAAALRRLLDARAGGDALNALARTIARWVVSHRPEAIVVPAPDGPHSGAAVVLREAVEAGVELAAAVPSRTGLTPWRPRRRLEFAPLDGDQKTPPGARRLATGRFVAGLGGSPEQHSRTARGLLSGATAPDAYAWRAIDGAPLGGGRSDAPLDALALRRGGDARRTLAITPGRGVERLRRVAQKQRQLRAMLARDGGDPSVWSGQAIQLTGGLDTEAGATLLAELADGYRRTGLSERAAETRYLLARRYPEEPLADAAIVDLVRHYASGERAHASTRSAAAPPAAAPLANVDRGVALATYEASSQPTALSEEERLLRATRLAAFLEQARPTLFTSGAVRHQTAAIDRRAGRASQAERAMLVQSAAWVAKPWRRAAAAERWLADRDSSPPEMPMAACRRAESRPLLDGDLSETCWADADPIRLAGDAETTVRLVRDDDFLMLAIEAEAGAITDKTPRGPRTRDADLIGRDRVRLRIDLDRDYATAWQLSVDRFGRTHDALAGDPLWNPAWYVAAAEAADGWRIEAAIPLEELCDPSSARGAVWAVSIDRVCPGRRPSVWGDPLSDPASPDAFGLLMLD